MIQASDSGSRELSPAARGGRKRTVDVREVLNAIFYVLATGCQWKALPKDLPHKSTAHSYFMLWDWSGTLARIHDALYVAVRETAGKQASPKAAIVDSQSAKAAQKGGATIDPQGFDAGKKVTGPQAPYPCRHARAFARRERLARQHSGPRWRSWRIAECAATLPLHRENLRRRRLSGAENGENRRRDRLLENRDGQTIRCERLLLLAQALDCRADTRLDQPQPSPHARLRTLCWRFRRAPVCNGIMPPGDSGIMAPPCNGMIRPGRRVR